MASQPVELDQADTTRAPSIFLDPFRRSDRLSTGSLARTERQYIDIQSEDQSGCPKSDIDANNLQNEYSEYRRLLLAIAIATCMCDLNKAQNGRLCDARRKVGRMFFVALRFPQPTCMDLTVNHRRQKYVTLVTLLIERRVQHEYSCTRNSRLLRK